MIGTNSPTNQLGNKRARELRDAAVSIVRRDGVVRQDDDGARALIAQVGVAVIVYHPIINRGGRQRIRPPAAVDAGATIRIAPLAPDLRHAERLEIVAGAKVFFAAWTETTFNVIRYQRGAWEDAILHRDGPAVADRRLVRAITAAKRFNHASA